ncbi:MAG TPA: SRPBCC family protein [Gaiellales bacterium]|nr:SRPBCC family protein [Gaiellales bacterium]
MSMWCSSTTIPGSPAEVLWLLTDPTAIARWAPVPFEVLALEGRRLRSGGRARVAGRLAGRSVEFDVDVLRVSDELLELVADGPISLSVRYMLRPAASGSQVDASVSVDGRGVLGRVLAKATEALLAAGALRVSLERLARELEPALAA